MYRPYDIGAGDFSDSYFPLVCRIEVYMIGPYSSCDCCQPKIQQEGTTGRQRSGWCGHAAAASLAL